MSNRIVVRRKARGQGQYSDASSKEFSAEVGTTPADAAKIWGETKKINGAAILYLESLGLWPLPKDCPLRSGTYRVDKHHEYATLVAPLVDPATDQLKAVQVWLLRPDGKQETRADGAADRRTIGHTRGTVCKIVPGDFRPGLMLVEGVKDALALAKDPDPNKVGLDVQQMLVERGWTTQRPIWATCGTANMRDFQPPEGMRDLIVCADHDPLGGQAAKSCVDNARRAEGVTALALWSPVKGEDPYDVWKRGGELVPAWIDRRRRAPYAMLPPETALKLKALLLEESPDISGFCQANNVVRKKELLDMIAAEEAEQAFEENVQGPILEVMPGSTTETLDRIDSLLEGANLLFAMGEGGGVRVVAVSQITEERRRQLAEQQVQVYTGQTAVVPVNPHMLADMIGRYAYVYKETARGPVRTDIPFSVANAWLESGRARVLPLLRGLAPHPIIRPDGDVVARHGYDPTSKFFITWRGEQFVKMPVERALALFFGTDIQKKGGLFRTYPFEAVHHRLGALAMMLQVLDRHNQRLSPAWAFDAPTPRTGKMHLQRTITGVAINSGPVIYSMGDGPEERHKRVTHALIEGSPVVCFDNINGAFDSSDVASYLGEGNVSLRTYGMTGLSPSAVNSNTLTFTGNNIVMTNDMQTRVGKIRLDANVASPESRTFDFDPHAEVRAFRGRYLRAALSILAHGCKDEKAARARLGGLGIFEEFNTRIRFPLWELTGVDVGKCFEDMKGDDPAAMELNMMFGELSDWFKLEPFTATMIEAKSNVTEGASAFSKFRSAATIGKWLASSLGAVAVGRKLERRVRDGYTTYRLLEVKAPD